MNVASQWIQRRQFLGQVSIAAILAGTPPGWGNPRQKITKFPPELFLRHTAEREFVGPAVLEMKTTGELWMVAPWGRPPVNFGQVKGLNLPPYVYRSKDGGETGSAANG